MLVNTLTQLSLHLFLEIFLFFFVFEPVVSLRGCPYAKIEASTANLILYIFVLHNLSQLFRKNFYFLGISLAIQSAGEFSKLVQEGHRVLLDSFLEGFSHRLLPYEDRVLILLPTVYFEETLVILLIEVLNERHRKIAQEN